jgi:hypothetical protein
MEHLVRSLNVLWRSERLLAEYQLKQSSQKIQLNALAGLVGLFGLVMLSLAIFFALVPYWGHALSALAISSIDLLLAVVLILFARSRKPTAEVNMVTEVRDMAMSDIEEEFTLMQEEVVALKEGIHRFMQHPVDNLLPGAIGPLMSAVIRGLGASRK